MDYKYFKAIKKKADELKAQGKIEACLEVGLILEIAGRARFADLSDKDILQLADFCSKPAKKTNKK